jgi:hypothetical protein
MGLQFNQDAWNAGIHTSPIAASFPAYPIASSIHLSDIEFNELLMAVLLQACLGGSANMFRVQRITTYCFRFLLPSPSSVDLILRQKSIKASRFTLVFDAIDLALPPPTTTSDTATICFLSSTVNDHTNNSPVKPNATLTNKQDPFATCSLHQADFKDETKRLECEEIQ